MSGADQLEETVTPDPRGRLTRALHPQIRKLFLLPLSPAAFQ